MSPAIPPKSKARRYLRGSWSFGRRQASGPERLFLDLQAGRGTHAQIARFCQPGAGTGRYSSTGSKVVSNTFSAEKTLLIQTCPPLASCACSGLGPRSSFYLQSEEAVFLALSAMIASGSQSSPLLSPSAGNSLLFLNLVAVESGSKSVELA